jgi:hypothetical protein
MKVDKEIIKAVHDDKLEQFLKSINVYDSVINNKAKCKFCSELISMENLYTIFPESGAIKFACDKPACIAMMNSYLNEK